MNCQTVIPDLKSRRAAWLRAFQYGKGPDGLKPIFTWGGGGRQNGPLRALAKYLKNGLTDLDQTLLLSWYPIDGESLAKNMIKEVNFLGIFSDSCQMMLKRGRNIRWVEVL